MRDADTLAALATATMAQRVASLWQLFQAECVELESPLNERQRLAWTKCLMLEIDGAKAEIIGLFEVQHLIREMAEDARRP